MNPSINQEIKEELHRGVPDVPWIPESKDDCFVAGTLVSTDKGRIPIEHVKVGDMVLSQPEGGGERTFKRVTKTFVLEDKQIWFLKVATASAQYFDLLLTPNHPIWMRDAGWVSVAQLSFGDEVQLENGQPAAVWKVAPVSRTNVVGIGEIEDEEAGWVFHVDLREGRMEWDYSAKLSAEFQNEPGGLGIRNFQNEDFRSRVFTFEVEEFHTYYVGEHGLWVHNTSAGATGITTLGTSSRQTEFLNVPRSH